MNICKLLKDKDYLFSPRRSPAVVVVLAEGAPRLDNRDEYLQVVERQRLSSFSRAVIVVSPTPGTKKPPAARAAGG